MPEDEDTTAGDVTVAPAAEVTASEAVGQLKALFASLVPPEKIEIEDALGNKHLVRARLPARSQIIIIQHIELLMEIDIPKGMANAGAADLASMLVGFAKDERVLDGLCDAFAYAHPQALKAAYEAAVADAAVSDLKKSKKAGQDLQTLQLGLSAIGG